MLISSAIEILNSGIALKRGWSLYATPAINRHESALRIEVNYPAQQSERSNYPEYQIEVEGGARASFFITVEDCNTVEDLLYKLLTEVVMPIESHEWREFLRVHPTGWAPFHPHRVGGIAEWSKRNGTPGYLDLYFGVTR